MGPVSAAEAWSGATANGAAQARANARTRKSAECFMAFAPRYLLYRHHGRARGRVKATVPQPDAGEAGRAGAMKRVRPGPGEIHRPAPKSARLPKHFLPFPRNYQKFGWRARLA